MHLLKRYPTIINSTNRLKLVLTLKSFTFPLTPNLKIGSTPVKRGLFFAFPLSIIVVTVVFGIERVWKVVTALLTRTVNQCKYLDVKLTQTLALVL
jgi:hypothetical protein